MEKITILHNQTIIDIAIQYTGKAENCFELAIYNGISVSDPLIPGMSINMPSDSDYEHDTDITDYYLKKSLQPASGLLDNKITINPLSGINYWEIENTFEVQ